MKSAITVAAVAGLATAASAQNIGTVTVTGNGSGPVINANVGDTITIGVVVDDNLGLVFAFDVLVEACAVCTTADYTVVGGSLMSNPAVFGFNGNLNADGAEGLGGSSDILGPTLDAPLNGLTVFSFQITADSVGVISFDAFDGPGPNPALVYGEEGGIVINPADYDNVEFTGLIINVVPAPSGLALLGLGGLAAVRRRR